MEHKHEHQNKLLTSERKDCSRYLNARTAVAIRVFHYFPTRTEVDYSSDVPQGLVLEMTELETDQLASAECPDNHRTQSAPSQPMFRSM